MGGVSSVLWQTVSRDAFLGGGLCCSVEAQSGEDASEEEEEERRGRSMGEAGVTAGPSFSIMVEPTQVLLSCAFFPVFLSRAHSYRSNL